jgi:CHAD domain-containing protein
MKPTAETATVGKLVADYVATQCDVLACNDVGLRTGAPVVHETRVAARRLRSTLRTFGDVIYPAPAAELNNELVWYADLLGQIRDREVMSARLTTLIAELPPDQVRGSVEAEITKTLAKERDDAIQRLNAAMRTRRYQHLVQLLRTWKTAPPFTDAAAGKDRTAVKYVEKARRAADKRLQKADDDIERLHQARKAEKRLRYAAELVEPGRRAHETHRPQRKGSANPLRRTPGCRGRRQFPLHDQRRSWRGEERERVHLWRLGGQRAEPCSSHPPVTEELVHEPLPKPGLPAAYSAAGAP